MRFLADQDVWKATVDLLWAWGHDVITASELDLASFVIVGGVWCGSPVAFCEKEHLR